MKGKTKQGHEAFFVIGLNSLPYGLLKARGQAGGRDATEEFVNVVPRNPKPNTTYPVRPWLWTVQVSNGNLPVRTKSLPNLLAGSVELLRALTFMKAIQPEA